MEQLPEDMERHAEAFEDEAEAAPWSALADWLQDQVNVCKQDDKLPVWGFFKPKHNWIGNVAHDIVLLMREW